MYDHKHYVPVLRWKRAERIALKSMFEEDRVRLTPLIELTPRDFSEQRISKLGGWHAKLADTVEQIDGCWGRAPFFLDLWHLGLDARPKSGIHPLRAIGRLAKAGRLSLIPVTGLSRTASYQSAVASVVRTTRQGVSIRLHIKDIRRRTFQRELQSTLSKLGLHPTQVDLLVDYQRIYDSKLNFADLCTRLPDLHRWRTFSVISGAFPKDLTGFEKNRQHELQRLDWLTWRDQVTASQKLPRLPTFGDYTIQHAIFSEPPVMAKFSASIRYTSDEHWVIMRGENVFNDEGPGFAQWPANAQLLCIRPEFCGAAFCYGDEYIEDMSLQTEKTGNAETWLRAGINHHLTFAVRQIASLSGV
jgi:hypothetical protein